MMRAVRRVWGFAVGLAVVLVACVLFAFVALCPDDGDE